MIIESVGPKYKMPTNIKLYDGTTDLEDHLALRDAFTTRYSVRKVCFKEPHEINKIVRRANESLTKFKERWTVETGFIMGVPEIMKISSFIDSLNWLELAKRFSDKAPTTVNEMVKRKDDCPFLNNNHVIDQQRYDPETTIEEGIMLSHTGEGIMLSHTGEGTINLPVLHKEETTRPSLAGLKETQTDLVGFVRETTKSLGKIELEVCFGSKGLCKRTIMKFTVIRPPSLYNVILGRKGLRAFRMQEFKKKQMVKNEKEEEVETKALNVTKEILVNPAYPDQLFVIGRGLPETCKAQLKLLLKNNMYIFSWETADITVVPRRIIEHNLNVNASIKPERQKRKVLAHEKSEAVSTNVGEWVKAGERIPKKGQNRIKTGQKREAWRSQEKSEAVTIVGHVRFKVYELRISLD
nr:reverse transcriptase domain-containing protein [Tanacetum cinerariifolium]